MGDGSFHKEDSNAKSIAYWASADGADDFIMNVCGDRTDKEFFYVVGATASKAKDNNSVNMIVSKIKLYDLQSVWTKEVPVIHASGDVTKHAAAVAHGCDLIPGKDMLYVAGTVENGARLDFDGATSAGRDDIFVGQLSTIDGSINWLKQIGSNGDDRLARGGGVKADENGNAVLYGDTNGDFFRWRRNDVNPSFQDLFFMVVDQKDGKHQEPLKGVPFQDDTSAPKEWFGNVQQEDSGHATFTIIAIILLILAIGFVFYSRKQQRKRAESQKTSIFAYLQKFDVEDIDLRKSPPGGWHGTYLNKLAYGINKSETEYSGSYSDTPPEDGLFRDTKQLSHSSVVSDSLFMDTESTPSLGFSDNSNYDDLPSKYSDGSEGRPGMEII